MNNLQEQYYKATTNMNTLIYDILHPKLLCKCSLLFLNVDANDGQRNSQFKFERIEQTS